MRSQRQQTRISIVKWAIAVTPVALVLLAPAEGLGQNITQIIDSTGDGPNRLSGPQDIVAAESENVYVAGRFSDNVFEIKTWPPGLDVDGDSTERAGGVLQGGDVVVHGR